jgi:hypothetical protein
VDHGGHVGHQEGAGDPRKHTQQGGGPIQFGVQSIISSPTQSPEPPCLQIDVQDAFDL